jgi:hypothetical protein
MDEDWQTREHLAQAERYIAKGERNIARQQQIIADLERSGRNAEAARNRLHVLQIARHLLIADRDRLRKELAS